MLLNIKKIFLYAVCVGTILDKDFIQVTRSSLQVSSLLAPSRGDAVNIHIVTIQVIHTYCLYTISVVFIVHCLFHNAVYG